MKRPRVNEDTLQFAEAYAGWAKPPSPRLKGCLALLPAGGAVLELGCGAGNHSAEMVAAGFSIRATDGSPEWLDAAYAATGRWRLLKSDTSELTSFGEDAAACHVQERLGRRRANIPGKSL